MTNDEIEKLKNTTVLQFAQLLEDGLIHGAWLNENTSVLEFIKTFFNDWYDNK